ncbi:MAG: M20/M25/M40 family metallo-hydrolase [Myxococcales bacterium]
MRTPLLLVAALAACATAQPRGSTLADSAAPGLRSIRGEALSARIRFLSDDLLEGRFTGSRGHAIAERYVASEMQALGLEPAGGGGSYLQPVPLRAGLKDPQQASLSVAGGTGPGQALENERDFVLSTDLRSPQVDVEAPLVFVGYGVVAPEYGYDDLAGADLKGKIAVLFSGAPLSERADFFPPIAHAVLADTRAKIRRLAERGAVGMITVFRTEDEERLPWARVATSSRLEQMSWMKDGEPGASPAGVPLRGFLHWTAFEKVLARAGVAGGLAALEAKAKANALRPFDIRATLHGRLATRFRTLTSGNVVGILRGSDPALRDEYVVYSAHLDHLGIGAPIDGDGLYNGALDNASGVASVLEVARAFASLPRRPARSILFLTVTGEERGLLGSEYFARYPTVPAASLVADINIDMIVAQHPLADVVGLGAEHSTLAGPVREAAAALHLALSPDPQPRQMSFIRSDQYSFVKQGVPSIFIGPGQQDETGAREANIALRKQWTATRYHSPKDKWDPAYDYEAMAQVARVDFLTGLTVANQVWRPRWNEGDFFARFPDKAP